MDTTTLYEKEVSFQADRRRAGVKLIKIISDLWYDKSIEMVLFRNQLIDRNVSDIINLHGYAAEFVGKPISIFDSVKIAKAILELIDNEQKMKNFGNNSYKILNKSFNMNLWQQKMKEIFNKIMN